MEVNGNNNLLKQSREGDIKAFHILFEEVKSNLKSYLYRIVTDRSDVEDLVHDTFVKGFDSIKSFRGDASLKTWLFSIGTHLALNFVKDRKRWPRDILDLAKQEASKHKYVRDYLQNATTNPHGKFDFIEHIDFCFTCISKTIKLEQQVALLLVDVYDFKIKEVAVIMNKNEAAVKHYVRLSRQTMAKVFDHRCALINKTGACHQCSQLNSWLNPKQKMQEALVKKELNKGKSNSELLALRTMLIKQVDPLRAKGTDLHEAFMDLHRKCAGEAIVLAKTNG
jgi:RNA polymerase sigma-70 factor, ECF subfamily